MDVLINYCHEYWIQTTDPKIMSLIPETDGIMLNV
jgi:hypothetical protein